MSKLSFRAKVLFATLPMLLAASSSSFAETIKIGAVIPMTGPVAEDGAAVLKGAKLAVKLFNDAGGLNGDKIELLVEDGACIPAQSVAGAEKLVSANKVIALAGAFCSSSTGATMDVALRYKVPMVAGISTAPNLTERGNRYLFRIQATSQMLADAFAPKMMEIAGGKKVAFLVVNDDWGRSIAQYYKASLERGGAEAVTTQIFDTNETDLFSYITNIKRAEPDAIMMAANTQNAVTLTEQLRQMNVKSKLFAEGSFTAKSYYDAVGKKGDGIDGLMAYVPNFDNPVNKTFVDMYKEAYGELPNNNASAGFEELTIITNAIKTAGKAEPEAIRDAIASGTTSGPSGEIKFNEKGQGYGFTVFLTRNENSKPVVEATAQIAKPN
jgi:branched-chain amino acid transport system substrate-binding protein